ncbi:MAG: GAF domain-containing sensor histidine kinase [Agarilytica sp.]
MHDYPSFVDDATFYNMHAGANIASQQAAMLSNLKEVFSLTTESYETFDDLVRAYLSAGRKIFDLETGIVSRIQDDIYTVVDVVSHLDAIQRGDEYPLEGTYCREVYNGRKVLGFPRVGALPFMKDHPVYVNLKLESYLSSPIEVDGELYGTLNFTSATPRKNGFSEHERELIVLMSKAIANFIVLRDRESKLQNANRKLKQFVGFVAHDLRNPLGAIQSLSKLVRKPNTTPERILSVMEKIQRLSSVTIEFVHSVLEVSALGTGKLEATLSEINMDEVLAFSLESLEELANLYESKINIVCHGSVVLADQHLLSQALVNLLANAVKYSPPKSVVKVTATEKQSALVVSIENFVVCGEQDDTTESARYKSVGFGMEIAREVIKAHGSELVVDHQDSSYKVSFALSLTA